MNKKDPNISEDISNESHHSQSSTKKGLRAGYTRTTLNINEKHLQALKDVAWSKRSTFTKVLENLIEGYVSSDEVKTVLSRIKSLQNEKD